MWITPSWPSRGERLLPGGGMERELAYYLRRVADERRAGMTAANETARRCHFEMAAAYETRVKKLKSPKQRSTLHIVAVD